jgi:hypothetical protein
VLVSRNDSNRCCRIPRLVQVKKSLLSISCGLADPASDSLTARIGTLSVEKQEKLEADAAKAEKKAEKKAEQEAKKKEASEVASICDHWGSVADHA